MEKNKDIIRYCTTLLFLLVLTLLSSGPVSSAEDTDSQEALNALEDFYQASIDEDLKSYIDIQDPYFLQELKDEGIDPIDYFNATFQTFDILSYSIEDPEIFIEDNTALIYYNLEGEFEEEETGTESIDNDMVAFLWKYDDWKIRWTITRTLYEEKIAMGLATDIVIETTFEDIDNKTIRDEMIEEGFEIDLDEEYEKENDNEESGFPWFWIILIVICIIIYTRRKHIFTDKNKKKVDSIIYKTKNHSKKIYSDAKPMLSKAYKDAKDHSKELYRKTGPRIKEIQEKGRSKMKNIQNKSYKNMDDSKRISKDKGLFGWISDLSSNTKIAAFWIVIALIGFIIGGTNVGIGIIIAGILSWVLWNRTMNSSWKGTVEDIKTRRISKGGYDDEDSYYQDVKYAYIRLESGKVKKIRAHPGWKKGDTLVKEKGKYSPYIQN